MTLRYFMSFFLQIVSDRAIPTPVTVMLLHVYTVHNAIKGMYFLSCAVI